MAASGELHIIIADHLQAKTSSGLIMTTKVLDRMPDSPTDGEEGVGPSS